MPGQSLDEQRFDLGVDRLLGPCLFACFFVALAVIEWWRFFVPRGTYPVVFSVLAVLGVAYAVFRWRRAWPEIKALRLALDGERVVGQYLEGLREAGYQVFHDVVGEGFNLDHVLIGAAGVFTVETKTRSKPVRGDARVVFDGEHILVDGFEPDRNPIMQARAQAAWLRALLTESTGKSLVVRPVVVFPGWFVERSQSAPRDLWVLEPKALPSFLAHEATVLQPEDIKLASFHLSRFVRC